MNEKQKILIVDDKKENLFALRRILHEVDAEVIEATGGNEALAATLDHRFAVAILDVEMPGMNGYELAECLRGEKQNRTIPIIFLTASHADERHMFKGYDAGGVDYLTKPCPSQVLLSKINIFLELDHNRREMEAHRNNLEMQVAERTKQMNDRLKELQCLFGISKLVEQSCPSIDESLQAVAALIPSGWQYPEITGARIILEGREVTTANFRETAWKQLANIMVSGQTVGTVEVCYLEERPALDGGPFLKEERGLIIDIARQLGVMIGRHRAEVDLAKAAQEWSATFDAISDAICIMDLDGRIFRCNAAAGTLLGMGCAEIVGLNCHQLLHGQDVCPPDCALQRILESGERASCTFQYGDRWLLDTVDPRRDADGNLVGVVLIFADITAQRELEQQLLQAQKMEIVGNLAGGIAHDFNNILTAVMANLDLIRTADQLDAEAADYLVEARSELDRAALLTSHLLSFSRRQILQPASADLNKIVSNMGLMLLRVLGEHVMLDIRLATDPILVMVDVAQIEQALMNLCVNARDAMPSGGNLVIAIRELELMENHVHIAESEVPAGHYAFLEITDTGIGMDAETRAHIFEPFFTTKEQGKGTGLGLSMVFGIVKQHHGYVFAYSEPGHGTSFKIYLPWMTHEAPEVESNAVAVSDDAVRGGGETILVAEDEAALARVVKRVLVRFGYTVIQACDGVEAVEIFARDAERIDLVLLDAVMPKMGGKEAAAGIRALKPDQRIIFTSGYSADSGFHEDYVLPTGINFIQKPYTASDLARAVRRVLDGGL